ncbi:hypothetical protein CEXT_135851 [Caerostris extrusa]|uniref:Laminin G domain-containing protein n=1 Tax=Caerostris extrusa TaxID=172846 RepID=A0AAV4N839_CAEEX|nr:hypothetical protein CEXT_135851 [Caerostris extrusa]
MDDLQILHAVPKLHCPQQKGSNPKPFFRSQCNLNASVRGKVLPGAVQTGGLQPPRHLLEVRTPAETTALSLQRTTDGFGGKGDYVSLAIKDGFVGIRKRPPSYDLGRSGVVVLRSSQRLQLGRFHRIIAKRYQRDGMLSVDGQASVLKDTARVRRTS